MPKLKPGDRVNCRLRASQIVKPYDGEYDDEKVFEIIAVDDQGYYLFVPPYLSVKDSEKVDFYFARDNDIEKKYIGEEVIYITPGLVSRVNSVLDGCFCVKCNNFHQYAEPNQTDGTLICWTCRTYPDFQSHQE
jgi:hypothetical protein